MDLENFVTETLNQIFRGVEASRQTASDAGGEINPQAYGKTMIYDNASRAIHAVEFDVAVTVEDKGDAKAGISVMGIDAGISNTETNSTVSRIKFQVPVSLPHHGVVN
jgi:hypothetical protein